MRHKHNVTGGVLTYIHVYIIAMASFAIDQLLVDGLSLIKW